MPRVVVTSTAEEDLPRLIDDRRLPDDTTQRGHTSGFEYDPAVKTFAGHVIDLSDEVNFEGASVEELKASMERAVGHYLEVCELRGEDPALPCSGQLRLRMDSDLHQRAAVFAATSGLSLNALVVRALEHEMGAAS